MRRCWGRWRVLHWPAAVQSGGKKNAAATKNRRQRGGVLANCLRQQGAAVWETLCVSGCACMATFPVLVLRGLSTSLYALVSSVAVLWLVEPILLLGWRQHSPGWPRRWSRCTGPRRSGQKFWWTCSTTGPVGVRLAGCADLF